MKISLYDNAPVSDDSLAEQELYDDALAHIWEGYMHKWPHRKSSFNRSYSSRCLMADAITHTCLKAVSHPLVFPYIIA